MDIELRQTTENDLPYVCAAESDAENSRFINVWSEAQHRAALDDAYMEHLILVAQPQGHRRG